MFPPIKHTLIVLFWPNRLNGFWHQKLTGSCLLIQGILFEILWISNIISKPPQALSKNSKCGKQTWDVTARPLGWKKGGIGHNCTNQNKCLQSRCFFFGPMTSSVVALQTAFASPWPAIEWRAASNRSLIVWPDIFAKKRCYETASEEKTNRTGREICPHFPRVNTSNSQQKSHDQFERVLYSDSPTTVYDLSPYPTRRQWEKSPKRHTERWRSAM